MFSRSMTRLQQLDKQIARLQRRTEFLELISRKYWNARRIIFIAGGLLALVFCNVSGTRAGWIAGGAITILFTAVTIFHRSEERRVGKEGRSRWGAEQSED